MVSNPVIKPTLAMVREIKLLRAFSDNELEKLLTLGEPQSFEPHASIVIEGELSWGLYLILEGMVGIFKTNKLSGDVYDIGQIRAGSFFGEMSLVDDNPRSATIRALIESHLFYISKQSFLSLLESSPDLAIRFYQSCTQDLVHRLRELGDEYIVSQYQLWKTIIHKEATK